MWGDSIVLGYFLGIKELGIYRVGVTFLTFVFGLFFNPLVPVVYSAFSRLQSNREELKQSFLKMTKLITSISLPIGVGLAILAQPISSLLFGQKWEGIEIVIAIIGITHAISWFIGINPEVYRAAGRPDVNAKFLMVAVIYYIPVYVLAAPYGLFVFCLARLTVCLIALHIQFFLVNKVFSLPSTYLKSSIKAPFLSSLVMITIIYIAINLFLNSFTGWQGWLKLAFIFFLGFGSYVAMMLVLDENFTQQTIWSIKAAIQDYDKKPSKSKL